VGTQHGDEMAVRPRPPRTASLACRFFPTGGPGKRAAPPAGIRSRDGKGQRRAPCGRSDLAIHLAVADARPSLGGWEGLALDGAPAHASHRIAAPRDTNSNRARHLRGADAMPCAAGPVRASWRALTTQGAGGDDAGTRFRSW